MKLTTKPVMAGILALAITGAGVFAAMPASANTPGTADPNSLGPVVFYDAAGHVLTGGSNLNHLADYIAAGTHKAQATTKATLYIAFPDHTVADSTGWNAYQASSSKSFPITTGPFQLDTPNYTDPLVSASASEANLNAALGSFTSDTTAGYANRYQVRIYDSSPTIPAGNQFWSTDIQVDPTAGTWSVLYPALTTTSSTIAQTAGPASPQITSAGNTTQSITLKATETPATAGYFQFYDGTTATGSPIAVDGTGAASYTTTPPAVASGSPDVTHQYNAVFVPAGGNGATNSSTSTYAYTVTAPKTATTTTVSDSGGTTAYSQQTLTATVSPSGATGSVSFTDNGTALSGTVTKSTGTSSDTYTLTTSSLAQGSHSVNAFFAATGTYASSDSTGAPASFTLGAALCPGDPSAYPAGQGCSTTGNVQTTVTPGYLTISTPYTATNAFVLPAMTLNSAGTLLSTSGTFPKATDAPLTVVSTLSGDPNWTASVVATDLNGTGVSHPAGTNDVIDGRNLGLVNWATVAQTNSATVLHYTGIPSANVAAGTGVQPGDSTTTGGLKAGPTAFASTTGGGNGTVTARATMTLNAPTNTVTDTYTGSITFSVA